jgi:hypothetical protein
MTIGIITGFGYINTLIVIQGKGKGVAIRFMQANKHYIADVQNVAGNFRITAYLTEFKFRNHAYTYTQETCQSFYVDSILA